MIVIYRIRWCCLLLCLCDHYWYWIDLLFIAFMQVLTMALVYNNVKWMPRSIIFYYTICCCLCLYVDKFLYLCICSRMVTPLLFIYASRACICSILCKMIIVVLVSLGDEYFIMVVCPFVAVCSSLIVVLWFGEFVGMIVL